MVIDDCDYNKMRPLWRGTTSKPTPRRPFALTTYASVLVCVVEDWGRLEGGDEEWEEIGNATTGHVLEIRKDDEERTAIDGNGGDDGHECRGRRWRGGAVEGEIDRPAFLAGKKNQLFFSDETSHA
jgi:hypothetical protein